MKKILITLAAAMVSLWAGAASFETFVYNVCEDDTLRLDYYRPAQADAPLMVFAFGGGFMGGQRHTDDYDRLFNYLCDNGVAVATVDYRTVLLADGPESVATIDGFCNALYRAITVAVTDYTMATRYLVANAADLGFDPAKVFAAGSSAGAITVLQTEISVCNGAQTALPEGFNFAGVISMAGAVCALGQPQWDAAPAPMLLFHGDADSNVPFDSIAVGGFGLFGSQYISRQLAEAHVPHQFHIVRGANHRVNSSACVDYRGEVLDFIRTVSAGSFTRIVITDDAPAEPQTYQTEFTVEDFIRSNMQ